MHKPWSSMEDVPYCFSRSSVKFQDHAGPKMPHFDPKWAFPDCNSSLNSPMALKRCSKLYFLLRSSIKFEGHTGWENDDLNPIWVRLLSRSQLSNPSDLSCLLRNLRKNTFITNKIALVWKAFFANFQIWKSLNHRNKKQAFGSCSCSI